MESRPRRFSNPPGSPKRAASPMDYAAFFARRALSAYARPRVPEGHVLIREEALRQVSSNGDVNSITWLGHAALFIRAAATGILVDPFLSQTAGPGRFGAPRFAGPTIGIPDLGSVDAILISHNHYDHLDVDTLRTIGDRRSIPVIVPLGLRSILTRIGFRQVIEVNWYDTVQVGDVTIHAVPAIHWSKRGLNDENLSLWCGYLIEWEGGRVYFSGDTAYGPVFRDLRERWGHIDLGIIGIGAYEPASIMKAVHTTPEEAVRIGRDMNCAQILGMHWGTVVLSDEDPWEPPDRFRGAGRKAGYGDDELWLFGIGETRPFAP